MRVIIRHVRTWCRPGQRGPLGLSLIVSLLLRGPHASYSAERASRKTQRAIGTLVVIRPDKIEDRLRARGSATVRGGCVTDRSGQSGGD